METPYRIGTRTSLLALKQVEEVLGLLGTFYPDMKVKVIGIDTYGDKDNITPISKIEGTDFFTREIDEALLKEEIDFAVHSAKDIPDILSPGLSIAAFTWCLDPDDALISRDGKKLEELPDGARIGTSSRRRKDGLKRLRPGLHIVDIRGNIEQRLKMLEENNLDGIVIAACALMRLGLESRITQRIAARDIKPHPMQGRLAIVTRQDEKDLAGLFSALDDSRRLCGGVAEK
ncbi:MAG: hydroxymethylbilane synthase [Candidatus Omnitrophota bacterium]|nr:hydroxymethylbilane synthase [Candidatus Omnitrophota bacterium]